MATFSEMEDKNQPVIPASTPANEAPVLNLMRLEKIQRWFQAGAGLVLLVFIILIGYSYTELQKIKKDIGFKRQEREKLEQEIAIKKAMLEVQEKELEEKQIKINIQQGGISALQQTLDTIVKENPGQEKFIRKSLEQNIALNAKGKQILPRIYIQIASEDQRPQAAEIVRALQAKGFIVPGIENMAKNPASIPASSELRYYDSDDVTTKDLQDIKAIISDFGVTLKPQPIKRRGTVRPRHYEIWFSNSMLTRSAKVLT